MNYSEIENWLKQSKDRYSAFYKGSPSVVSMRLMLFFLRLLAVSLFSLWLIKLVRRRNNHMSDLHSLLDTHFAEGEKLLDEYRHTIS